MYGSIDTARTSFVPGIQSIVPSPQSSRVQSIDILRGATVALMIMVNDPGDPHEVFPALRHSDWSGYTAADLVFPNFLFLSGASLVFSLQSRIQNPAVRRAELVRGLLKRFFNLMALKLFVAAAPTFRVRRVRIFGILFRSAVLGLVGGLVLLTTLSPRKLFMLCVSLLAAYYGLLRVPFGSLNQPLLDPENNLVAALDRRIAHLFHGHLHSGALFHVTHDPEGLLSSMPALVTVLGGCLAALHMRDSQFSPQQKARNFALAGAACLVAGHVWDRRFPINKSLWTSSYVLVTTGWSLMALSALYWIYDVRQLGDKPLVRVLTRPLQIFGANALPAYVLSILGHKTTRTIHLQQDGHSVSLRTAAYRKAFAPDRSTRTRSLAFAVAVAAVCFLPNLYLWRKKIFVKI